MSDDEGYQLWLRANQDSLVTCASCDRRTCRLIPFGMRELRSTWNDVMDWRAWVLARARRLEGRPLSPVRDMFDAAHDPWM